MEIDDSLQAHVEETRQFNAAYAQAMAAQPLGFATAEDALRTRAALDAVVPPLPPDALQPEIVEVGAAGAQVTLRVFRPERIDGVCVQFHMGAWIIGSARAGDARSAAIAQQCNVAVVSVEYRLVPESLPPAQLEDALAAIDWVRRDADLADKPVVLIGESAGATLAVLSLVALRERGELGDDIVGTVLSYGLYDVSGGPSQRLDVAARAVFDDAQSLVYPGLGLDDRRAAHISPLYADLAALPPALLSVGTADALLDDTLFMYERWTAAGNDAQLEVYPESFHGFDTFPTEMAAEAHRRIDRFIVARVAGAGVPAQVRSSR
ncbi:MAG: Alpha/beta hydrolase fold-3 domain protein [Ilumatobacteraceae bacterium]|nr:Alpha/beta hydrolase fold-3 domain protein [Ilumatobacteraceae bacterium]